MDTSTPDPASVETATKTRTRKKEPAEKKERKRKRRGAKPASWVWNYFTATQPVPSNSKFTAPAVCQLCGHEMESSLGTSNIIKHLANRHAITPKSHSTGVPEVASQELLEARKKRNTKKTLVSNIGTDLQSFTKPGERYKRETSAKTEQKWVDCLVRHQLPLDLGESPYFRSFFFDLSKKYSPPSQQKVEALLSSAYRLALEQVEAALSQAAAVHLELTLWPRSGKREEGGDIFSTAQITGHFVNDNFELYRVALRTKARRGPYASPDILSLLQEVVEDFHLGRKVASLLCPEAQADVAVKLRQSQQQWLLLTCQPDFISVALREAAEVASLRQLLDRAQCMLEYFLTNQTAREKLKALQERAGDEEALLASLESEVSPFGIITQVTAYRQALERYKKEELENAKSSSRSQRAGVDEMWLTSTEFDAFEEVQELLSTLQNISGWLQGHMAGTVSIVRPCLYDIENFVRSISTSPSSTDVEGKNSYSEPCREVATAVGEVVSNWQKAQDAETETLYLVASLLDPRFKHGKFAGEEKWQSVIDFVKREIEMQAAAGVSVDGTQTGTLGDAKGKGKRQQRLRFSLTGGGNVSSTGNRTDVGQGEHDGALPISSTAVEVDSYLEETFYLPARTTEDREKAMMAFDVLGWWRKRQLDYPHLSQLARRYLSVPASLKGDRESRPPSAQGWRSSVVEPGSLDRMAFLQSYQQEAVSAEPLSAPLPSLFAPAKIPQAIV